MRLRTRRTTVSWKFVLLVYGLSLACGDATGVEPKDLEGTWVATSAVATNVAVPSETADLLALGASISFVIDATGGLESIFEFQGDVDRDIGTLAVEGDMFTLILASDRSTGTISRRNDVLTIDVRTGVEWDFRDDGLDEPATLLIVLARSS